jgi:hypothetical protein
VVGVRLAGWGSRSDANAPGALHLTCDVRDPEGVDTMRETVISEYGRLDVLVNNAGGSPYAHAADASRWPAASPGPPSRSTAGENAPRSSPPCTAGDAVLQRGGPTDVHCCPDPAFLTPDHPAMHVGPAHRPEKER